MMINDISSKQNKPKYLKLLAAQRQLYSEAKFIQSIRLMLSVPLAIILSILALIIPNVSVYTALYGIFVTFFDIVLFSQQQKDIQEKAAKIQQQFDCDVLELDWNQFNIDNYIPIETIDEYSQKFQARNKEPKLLNWYAVEVKKLPIWKARVICQRSNVWWDAKLRRRYANYALILFFILLFVLFLLGIVGGLTTENFILTIVNPLAPALILTFRQYQEQKESATKLDNLFNNAESLFNELSQNNLNQQEIEEKSYRLQNQIYENRRCNPPIPDWFYKLSRDKNEELMNKGVESLIAKIKA